MAEVMVGKISKQDICNFENGRIPRLKPDFSAHWSDVSAHLVITKKENPFQGAE